MEREQLFECNELQLRERGKYLINSDRATECAMTNVGADNSILCPKNLLKALQEGLSLNAQDDERVTVGWACQSNNETFISRPLRERRNFLANVNELRNFRDKGNRRALAMRVTLSALAEWCKNYRTLSRIRNTHYRS